MILLVDLRDGRAAHVTDHARTRARQRIGATWLSRLVAASRVDRWPARGRRRAAAAYVHGDATFVGVEGAGDCVIILTAYVSPAAGGA